MVKKIIEKIIKKRNPYFAFDKNINSEEIIFLIFSYIAKLVRGYKYVFFFRFFNLVFFGRNVKLESVKKIYIGRKTKIGDNVKISSIGKKHGVVIGHNCSIGAFSQLVCTSNYAMVGKGIIIGDNVGMGEFAYIGGAGGVIIKKNTIIGQYFSCHPQNHNFLDTTKLIRHQGTNCKGIFIGENCWIGTKVTILDGVEVGNGCVIGAGSLITKSVPENSIVIGIPGRVIGTR